MANEQSYNLCGGACPSAYLVGKNGVDFPLYVKVMLDPTCYNLDGGVCPGAYLLDKKALVPLYDLR